MSLKKLNYAFQQEMTEGNDATTQSEIYQKECEIQTEFEDEKLKDEESEEINVENMKETCNASTQVENRMVNVAAQCDLHTIIDVVDYQSANDDLKSRVEEQVEDNTNNIKETCDESTQIENQLVNIAVQCDLLARVDVGVQSDNDDVSGVESTNSYRCEIVDAHAVKTIQYACDLIGQSLEYKYGRLQLSMSTQTDKVTILSFHLFKMLLLKRYRPQIVRKDKKGNN